VPAAAQLGPKMSPNDTVITLQVQNTAYPSTRRAPIYISCMYQSHVCVSSREAPAAITRAAIDRGHPP
jgi:hypothetical protein